MTMPFIFSFFLNLVPHSHCPHYLLTVQLASFSAHCPAPDSASLKSMVHMLRLAACLTNTLSPPLLAQGSTYSSLAKSFPLSKYSLTYSLLCPLLPHLFLIPISVLVHNIPAWDPGICSPQLTARTLSKTYTLYGPL